MDPEDGPGNTDGRHNFARVIAIWGAHREFVLADAAQPLFGFLVVHGKAAAADARELGINVFVKAP